VGIAGAFPAAGICGTFAEKVNVRISTTGSTEHRAAPRRSRTAQSGPPQRRASMTAAGAAARHLRP